MEHLVRFTSSEGRDGYHNAQTLEDALKFVERLRNNEEVEKVRLFRLHELPIEFKAYYKVELSTPEVAAPPPAQDGSDASLAPAPPAGDDGEDALVAAPSGGPENGAGRRLFGRPS